MNALRVNLWLWSIQDFDPFSGRGCAVPKSKSSRGTQNLNKKEGKNCLLDHNSVRVLSSFTATAFTPAVSLVLLLTQVLPTLFPRYSFCRFLVQVSASHLDAKSDQILLQTVIYRWTFDENLIRLENQLHSLLHSFLGDKHSLCHQDCHFTLFTCNQKLNFFTPSTGSTASTGFVRFPEKEIKIPEEEQRVNWEENSLPSFFIFVTRGKRRVLSQSSSEHTLFLFLPLFLDLVSRY